MMKESNREKEKRRMRQRDPRGEENVVDPKREWKLKMRNGHEKIITFFLKKDTRYNTNGSIKGNVCKQTETIRGGNRKDIWCLIFLEL